MHGMLWLGRAVGLALIALVIFLSLTPHPPQATAWTESDKLGHLLAYATLMAWHAGVYPGRRSRWVWAVCFVLMGVMLEIVQGLGGVRHMELFDMVANTLGVIIGWTAFLAARRWARPAKA